MVSIIIPTYNSKKWVSKAIDSSLIQEGLAVEVVVIDDASTDGTPDWLEQHYQGRINIIRLKKNSGPSVARNVGIRAACGEYIALLDSDDWFESGRLFKLYEHADTTNADFVADGLLMVSKTGDVFKYPAENKIGLTRKIEFHEMVEMDLGPLKPLIKTSFLKNNELYYDENIRYAEDFDLLVRSFCRGCNFQLMEYYGYSRLMREGSLSKNTDEGISLGLRYGKRYLREATRNKEAKVADSFKKRLKKLLVLRHTKRKVKFGYWGRFLNLLEKRIIYKSYWR